MSSFCANNIYYAKKQTIVKRNVTRGAGDTEFEMVARSSPQGLDRRFRKLNEWEQECLKG